MNENRRTARSQPISFYPEDLDFLRRKAAETGLSLSALVRQYIRAERQRQDHYTPVVKVATERGPA